jgi:hypothetical protein
MTSGGDRHRHHRSVGKETIMLQANTTPSSDLFELKRTRDALLAEAAAYIGDAEGSEINLAGYAQWLDTLDRAVLQYHELSNAVGKLERRVTGLEILLELREFPSDPFDESE